MTHWPLVPEPEEAESPKGSETGQEEEATQRLLVESTNWFLELQETAEWHSKAVESRKATPAGHEDPEVHKFVDVSP